MQPIATDGVEWSVCLSVTTMSAAKTAEPIEIPFGIITRLGPRNHVLEAVQIPTREGEIPKAKSCWPDQYTQSDLAEGSTGAVRNAN